MFTKHLFKVIVGFCGMILLGLITLVVFDTYKEADRTPSAVIQTPVIETSVTQPQQAQKQKTTQKKVQQ